MTKICSVYTTFSDKSEAKKIITSLLSKKLIACANIFDNISSMYEWKGEVEMSNEVVAFLKTKEENFNKVCDFIKSQHSYDCPCILQFSLTDGNQEYITWVRNNH